MYPILYPYRLYLRQYCKADLFSVGDDDIMTWRHDKSLLMMADRGS